MAFGVASSAQAATLSGSDSRGSFSTFPSSIDDTLKSASMEAVSCSGAEVVADTLRALGVSVVFGIVGIPIVEIAEACIAQGIRFIAFRNEQAASYAASVYGYLTGRPGVLLVVGGPGVVHALAGVIINSQIHRNPRLISPDSFITKELVAVASPLRIRPIFTLELEGIISKSRSHDVSCTPHQILHQATVHQ